MLHFLMCSSFIGRVANTSLHLMLLLYASWCSVVLQDDRPRLACVQLYCRTAGLGWLVFSIIAGRLACVW